MLRSPIARWFRRFLIQLLIAIFVPYATIACTNLLVTPAASADGSSYVTYSCDGGIFAAVRLEKAADYAAGTTSLLMNDTWYMYGGFRPGALGRIPQVEHTHQYLDLLAGPDYFHIGGMNEHGVCIAETTIVDTRAELSNPNGWMAAFSGYDERSLMTLALQRATSAREAVLLIGNLAEEYGYRSTFPIEGEQFAIGDGVEVWSMEIFGPGPNWHQGSSRAGAVWCAQRVPDGQIAVSANRSRISQINLNDPSHFLASPNVFALAEEMGWWTSESGDPFSWNQVYAPSSRWTSVVREWRALDLAGPSSELAPDSEQLPFSILPDSPLSSADVIAIQRDLLEGTEYDITEDPAFAVDGETSSLACPSCSHDYYDLFGVEKARTIANPATSVSCVYQTNVAAPTALRGCTWLGYGNAATTCYVPIYSGLPEIPEEWSATDLSEFDPQSPFWALTLPGKLATIQWQDAYPEIQSVRDPAERAFIGEQETLYGIVDSLGDAEERISALLTEYTVQRLEAVRSAYVDLHEYLVAQFFSGIPRLLAIAAPTIQILSLEED